DRACKFRRLHVIRVSAEAGVAPGRVPRVAARLAQTSQAPEMPVGDSGGGERLLQRLEREVRMPPRFWNGPHVRNLRNVVGAKKRDELVERSGRMTNCIDDRRGHVANPATNLARTEAGSTSPRLPRPIRQVRFSTVAER